MDNNDIIIIIILILFWYSLVSFLFIIKTAFELNNFNSIFVKSICCDLEYFKDILSERQIRSLQITIDGKRENHDSKRFHYTEGGSFDKIIDNIGVAIKKGVKVSVRINTDKDNYHDLEYLKTLFKEYGFLDSHLFNFYSAYIYATDY